MIATGACVMVQRAMPYDAKVNEPPSGLFFQFPMIRRKPGGLP